MSTSLVTATHTSPPRTYPNTLVDHIFVRTRVKDALFILSGAAFTAVLAQIVIPLWPVPITGQTLAVLLVGGTLGARRGILSMLLYAIFGIIGLPVFSDASSGWSIIAGPRGGYIVGFIIAAGFTGWLVEHHWDRTVLKSFLLFGGATVITFAVGLPWLSFSLGLDAEQTFQMGFYPFIISGIIKTLIAAGVMKLAWSNALL